MRWSEEELQSHLNKKSKKPTKPKKSKYNNKKTEVDGIIFDSKREAEYYSQLKLLEKTGIIKILELQPKFILQESFKKNGTTHRAITYKADFKIESESGEIEIIDVKGFSTEVFKIKRKLFEYKYPEYDLKLVK